MFNPGFLLEQEGHWTVFKMLRAGVAPQDSILSAWSNRALGAFEGIEGR
jgi:hypothetical protein